MMRSEKLKLEKSIIEEGLSLIPLQAKSMLLTHYQNEIDAIEKYGAEDIPANTSTITALKKILKGY